MSNHRPANPNFFIPNLWNVPDNDFPSTDSFPKNPNPTGAKSNPQPQPNPLFQPDSGSSAEPSSSGLVLSYLVEETGEKARKIIEGMKEKVKEEMKEEMEEMKEEMEAMIIKSIKDMRNDILMRISAQTNDINGNLSRIPHVIEKEVQEYL